jgi:hypothetical protein
MKPLRLIYKSLSIIMLAGVAAGAVAAPDTIDLRRAVIVTLDEDVVVRTARRMLQEEIAKRTGIALVDAASFPDGTTPAILLCLADRAPAKLRDFVAAMNVPENAEGFAIAVSATGGPPVVCLAGRDEPGVLFAAGRLLLQLRMSKGQLELPADYRIATAPRYPHRGHQIGFRNLAHCYDAWTASTYEQYMRELAVFGANAFETTSFSDPEQLDGPHAKVSRGDMAAAWSRICADYGFDFWLFTSALGGEGESPEDLEDAVEGRLRTLRAIPHLDHLYLTGGDGGSRHRRPDLMFEWTGRCAEEARKIHPNLGIWVSNQGFGPELNNWFFEYLQREQPDWVTGVVYGAWSRVLLDEQRARVPQRYPIRRYSDIGHCVRSQYPVPGWDRAFARTLGREPFAPRPRGHARIHNLFDEYADGFVTYSDGVGDDVNKIVWTALGWDPDRPLDDIMLEYARFFFGWDIAEQVREGLYRLEEHFTGSLAENDGVGETFTLWKALEDDADGALLANWRFQECLLRAYYDHYTRLRLLKANDIEERACAALRRAPEVGVEQAIARARAILEEPDQDEYTDTLKTRIVELGAELFESIGAQLDVANYKAKSPERGAVLDFLDTPLNNRLWLENEIDAILAGRFTASMPEKTGSGDVRLARLARVADWEDPGPGGFYDDLGAPNRLSWLDASEALYATPLVLRYDDLDPDAFYRVRVTYLGRYNATIRLVADGEYEIHGPYGHTLEGVRYTATHRDSAAVVTLEEDSSPPVVTPLEFVIPGEATQDGVLELTWQRLTGRGTQVAEVWLTKG